MSQTALVELSNQLADVIAATAQSVVQVRGRKQPASGVVHSSDVVVTTTRAVGSEENITVRTPDGRDLPAEFAGWDPATHLVALRVKGGESSRIARHVGRFACAMALKSNG